MLMHHHHWRSNAWFHLSTEEGVWWLNKCIGSSPSDDTFSNIPNVCSRCFFIHKSSLRINAVLIIFDWQEKSRSQLNWSCNSAKSQLHRQLSGLHDHFNRGRLSIEFFSSQSFLFFHFESFFIIFDWLEKSLDGKPAPIEVIM